MMKASIRLMYACTSWGMSKFMVSRRSQCSSGVTRFDQASALLSAYIRNGRGWRVAWSQQTLGRGERRSGDQPQAEADSVVGQDQGSMPSLLLPEVDMVWACSDLYSSL